MMATAEQTRTGAQALGIVTSPLVEPAGGHR
jgi:hypothetical protein